jgi:hypothetical protein
MNLNIKKLNRTEANFEQTKNEKAEKRKNARGKTALQVLKTDDEKNIQQSPERE